MGEVEEKLAKEMEEKEQNKDPRVVVTSIC